MHLPAPYGVPCAESVGLILHTTFTRFAMLLLLLLLVFGASRDGSDERAVWDVRTSGGRR